MQVLDASSVVAFLRKEAGHDTLADAIAGGAQACTVNLSEVMASLVRGGMAADEAEAVVADLPIIRADFDFALAIRAGAMIRYTRALGLSLGDRACLALGGRENQPVLTADRDWLKVADRVGVEVRLIR